MYRYKFKIRGNTNLVGKVNMHDHINIYKDANIKGGLNYKNNETLSYPKPTLFELKDSEKFQVKKIIFQVH